MSVESTTAIDHLVLDTALVQRVARLARLDPDPAELESLRRELEAILDHFQNLASLDTAATEPAYHPQRLENQLRPDEVKPSLDRDIFMSLAIRHKDGCLMVPRTVE
jgi:aspartyl-tRNA(Asn)/glutamyl-tRNA(Gln) amidotransferase subunit C